MKKIVLSLLLSLSFAFAFAQTDIVGGGGQCKVNGDPDTHPVLDNASLTNCWMAVDTSDGTVYLYYPNKAEGDRWDPLTIIAGSSVNVTTGSGAPTFSGAENEGDIYVDTTDPTNPSGYVFDEDTSNWVLLSRSSGNGMFDLANQDSLWAVTRYYLPLQHYGYIREKGGFVLEDSSLSRYAGEDLLSIFASSGTNNPPVVALGSGNYLPQIRIEGDTSAGGGRIIFGSTGSTYDMPIKDPDAYALPPGQYLPTVDELGAPAGNRGWLNVDSILVNDKKTRIREVSIIDSLKRNESLGDYYQEGALPFLSERIAASNTSDNYFSETFTPLIKNSSEDSINYIYASEDIRVFGGIPSPWSFSGISSKKDAIVGPYSTLSERLELLAATGDFRAQSLDTSFQSIPVSVGDTVTVSGWILPGVEAFNDNLSFQVGEILNAYEGGLQSVSFDPSLKEWQLFKVRLVYEGVSPRKNIRFVFSGDAGDYFHITRISYNIGGDRYYQKTDATSRSGGNTAYAVFRPKNSVLSLGEVIFSPLLQDEGQRLNEALQYCRQTGNCNEVRLSKSITTDTTIVVPEYIHLNLNGYTITYNGSDPSINIIQLADTESDAYAYQQKISNGTITATAPANAMLEFQECFKPVVDKLDLNGNDLVQIGLYAVDRGLGEATISPLLNNLSISGFLNSGVNVDRFNDAQFFKCAVLRNGYGLYFQRSQNVYFHGGSIEDNDSTYFYMPNGTGKVEISNVYFEDTPNTTPSYRLVFNNPDNVTIRDCNFLATNDPTPPDANISATGVGNIAIKNNDFNSGGGQPINIDPGIRWNFYENSFNIQRLSDSIYVGNPLINFTHAERVEKRDSFYMAGKFIPFSYSPVRGVEDTTTDGTGDVTITHSLGFTPTNINVTPLGTGGSPLLPQVLSNTINSTTFTVRWFTPSTGLAATSAAVNFHWSAE